MRPKKNTKTNKRTFRAKKPKAKPRNTIPMATRTKFSKDFRILRQNGTSATVSGRDLIYTIPDTLTAPIQTTQVITIIPANPAYWIGTRIGALAQGYQNYRPLYFEVTYVPQCAVTQQGNVLAGTIWNQAPNNQGLQQTLRTSNGGQLSQCYNKFTSIVRPKSNLQYNLYRMAGQFDQESNPFIYIALAIGCTNANGQKIVPGYFYVTWKYELKNPIGEAIQYYNTGLILYQNIETNYNNKTIVFAGINDNIIATGTTIQLEDDGNTVTPLYNGSVLIPSESSPVWEFGNNNTTKQTTRLVPVDTKTTIYYTAKYTSQTTESGIGYTVEEGENYVTHLYTSSQSITYPVGSYKITRRSQNFGSLVEQTASKLLFSIPKEKAEMVLQLTRIRLKKENINEDNNSELLE
jgi:hypothetical protein